MRYLVGAFPVQLLLVLVPLHELLHEGDCHFAILELGPAVLVLDGWCANGEQGRESVATATVGGGWLLGTGREEDGGKRSCSPARSFPCPLLLFGPALLTSLSSGPPSSSTLFPTASLV